MYRSQMTREERESRSRLKPYIIYQSLLKGSLTMRKHTCGKANCKCAKSSYKHSSLYLTRMKNGKIEQLYMRIPMNLATDSGVNSPPARHTLWRSLYRSRGYN